MLDRFPLLSPFHQFQVGDQHGLRDSDVRLWRVPVHEDRAQGYPSQHDAESGPVMTICTSPKKNQLSESDTDIKKRE